MLQLGSGCGQRGIGGSDASIEGADFIIAENARIGVASDSGGLDVMAGFGDVLGLRVRRSLIHRRVKAVHDGLSLGIDLLIFALQRGRWRGIDAGDREQIVFTGDRLLVVRIEEDGLRVEVECVGEAIFVSSLLRLGDLLRSQIRILSDSKLLGFSGGGEFLLGAGRRHIRCGHRGPRSRHRRRHGGVRGRHRGGHRI